MVRKVAPPVAMLDPQPMISIEPHPNHRGWHVLTTELTLPAPRPQVFEFFADAWQLERITPPWLHFRILTQPPLELRAGTLIDYHLRLHGIPMGWRTRISVWEPEDRFVDEQLRGPYRMWRHEHIFQEVPTGTQIVDRVEYQVPGGEWVHRWFVQRDLQSIFAFRQQALQPIFAPREFTA